MTNAGLRGGGRRYEAGEGVILGSEWGWSDGGWSDNKGSRVVDQKQQGGSKRGEAGEECRVVAIRKA